MPDCYSKEATVIKRACIVTAFLTLFAEAAAAQQPLLPTSSYTFRCSANGDGSVEIYDTTDYKGNSTKYNTKVVRTCTLICTFTMQNKKTQPAVCNGVGVSDKDTPQLSVCKPGVPAEVRQSRPYDHFSVKATCS
jgi:hypothetical protein